MPDASPEPKRRGESAKFLPVLFVVANICGIYIIYSAYHLIPLLEDAASYSRGLVESLIFNGVTLVMVICYVRCIVVSPGTIPHRDEDPSWEYVPQDSRASPEPAPVLRETKQTGERRHCKWCAKYKPDRCHHCRVCDKCILKMDHHCPWIYNCVGFRNHKYFFLLLFYSAIDCHFVTWTMLETVKNGVEGDTPFGTMFLLLFGETLAAFLALLVTGFFCFHVWLMLQAMTTIEFCEKSMKQTGYNTSIYDRGLAGNIRAVLGDYVILWLLPCCPPSGNGLVFVDEDAPLARDVEVGRGFRRKAQYQSWYYNAAPYSTAPPRRQGGYAKPEGSFRY